MKSKIKKWLGVKDYYTEIMQLEKQNLKNQRDIDYLNKELLQSMKFIGALYDFLGVRPQRTFVQDFSQLPQQETPTMEVIKVQKIKKSK